MPLRPVGSVAPLKTERRSFVDGETTLQDDAAVACAAGPLTRIVGLRNPGLAPESNAPSRA